MDGGGAVRQTGLVPRYARPANSDYAEDPINALGNVMQATIIGLLRKNPGLTRSEIAEAIELPKMTIANGLEKLLDADAAVLKLLAVDPFRGERPRAVRARTELFTFATREEHRRTGDVWMRHPLGIAVPAISLGPTHRN